MRLSIRTRLTVWNTAVTAAIVVALNLVLYLAFSQLLLDRIDAVLAFECRETVERIEQLGSDDDLGAIPAAFLEEYALRVTDDRGGVRLESPAARGADWPLPVAAGPSAEPAFGTQLVGPLGEQRTAVVRMDGPHAGWTVQIGTALADYRADLATLRTILLALVPVGLLVAAAAGSFLAGRALAPVERITAAARRISGSTLDVRITADRPDDELGRLAATLNAMVTRLADALAATRRFTADASHELMTPLAQIRTEAEVALAAERSGPEYAAVLRSIVEEVDRLSRLARGLLALAREDAQAVAARAEPCELGSLVRAAVAAIEPLAARGEVAVAAAIPASVTLVLDADRLRQVLDNLLHNAVRYSRPGGTVQVGLLAEPAAVTITITDTGIGIPAADLPRIFDRFYRVDAARSRAAGGTGLGLSIASSLVARLGGRIEAQSVVGQGSTFRIILPPDSHR